MATGVERSGKKTKRALFLEEMEQVVPWTKSHVNSSSRITRKLAADDRRSDWSGCCGFTLWSRERLDSRIGKSTEENGEHGSTSGSVLTDFGLKHRHQKPKNDGRTALQVSAKSPS